MSELLYYKAPPQEAFENLKIESIKLWVEIDPNFHFRKTRDLKQIKLLFKLYSK